MMLFVGGRNIQTNYEIAPTNNTSKVYETTPQKKIRNMKWIQCALAGHLVRHDAVRPWKENTGRIMCAVTNNTLKKIRNMKLESNAQAFAQPPRLVRHDTRNEIHGH